MREVNIKRPKFTPGLMPRVKFTGAAKCFQKEHVSTAFMRQKQYFTLPPCVLLRIFYFI